MTQPEPDVATLRRDSRGLDASRSHSFVEVESPSPQEALWDVSCRALPVETDCPQSCWSVVSLSDVAVFPNKFPWFY